jgi:hypothetical protein
MSEFRRLAAGVSYLGVLILSVVALARAGSLLSSFQGCSVERTSLAEENRREEQLDEGKDALHRRPETEWQAAAEGIAQRRSLAEAIERFRALNRQGPPGRLEAQKTEDFRMSEEKRDYQWVINYVREILADRPDEAAVVAGRLEKERQELLADRTKHRAAPAQRRR